MGWLGGGARGREVVTGRADSAARTRSATTGRSKEEGMMNWDLRHGSWREVLADVECVDAVICDPPYSSRTHEGHDAGANLANRKGAWVRGDGGVDVLRPRREISYSAWGREDIDAFVASWAPRCRGWFVAFS